MLEETDANWRSTVRQTIDLEPDSITIYQMEIPFNTTIYRRMKEEGKLEAPVADWETKRRWTDEAFAELEKAGYTIASAYTAVKDPSRTRFVYRDRLWAGADLLALGVSSFGIIHGTHYQNEHDSGPYLARVREGKLPVYRALTPTAEERLVRELVLQLKLGRVSRRYFEQKFGADIRERFAAPIESLAGRGMLSVDGDRIALTRAGLLRVDSLLHEFFLPEHRKARYS
jgi:oxygen-independent coproporphyrinogen-3 oxidase